MVQKVRANQDSNKRKKAPRLGYFGQRDMVVSSFFSFGSPVPDAARESSLGGTCFLLDLFFLALDCIGLDPPFSCAAFLSMAWSGGSLFSFFLFSSSDDPQE
nr:hypothetical protein [Pandoravirus massiliensis]